MLRLRAPAKLNLYLRVLGKRPDGYHEIETLFERIDLADTLTFEAQPRALELSCSDPTLSCGDDNLIMQAAHRLQVATGARQGARMHLAKRIPIAAGLGGGSSDAATTLLGLNELWGLRRSPTDFVELAAQVGSDVPFFLAEAPFAIGRGRGERVEPLACGTILTHVLVVPNVRLSSRDVYEAGGFDLTAPTPSSTMAAHALTNGSLGELAEGLWNDLEPEAIRRCPVIARIQSHLQASGCVGTRMSGSGPSVFGLCTDVRHAQDVVARLRPQAASDWRLEIVHTLQQKVLRK